MNDFLKYYKKVEQQLARENQYETRCPYCSMQCSMQLHEERRISRYEYKVTPNKQDPVSEGRLCIKGTQAHQHALHRKRLTSPMIRVGERWAPLQWKTATEGICNKIDRIQKSYGDHAVAVYGGGSLTNEECYLLGKFARVALNTPYIDYNGRFCMSSAATAANQMLGLDRGLTQPLADIPYTDCILLAGANIAECQPTMMPYFKRAKKNGAKIIVIDPRETMTSKLADIHLRVRPGADAALVNGMLKVIFDAQLENEAFIEKRTQGVEALREHLADLDLQAVAEAAGVDVEAIREAALAYGQAKTGMVFTARGVEQHASGVDNVKNFLNLVLVTGKIGRKYCGYGAVTGQGNGQGGREHGQKADQLPGYRSIENPAHRKAVARVWGVDEATLPGKGVSAYELMEKIHQGEIKMLIVVGSNPIVSNPNSTWVEQGLKKLDSLVTADLFLSETASLADYVLPAASYLEDEGTMTNLEGRVVHREKAFDPIGEAKPDWKILCELAAGLGKGKHFHFETPQAIFDELCRASKGGRADYSGMSYDRVRKEQGLFWPCRDTNTQGTRRMFTTRFATGNGKAAFVPIGFEGPREKPDDDYPVYLTTGRVMQHYLTGVQTRHSEALNKKAPEPLLEIHPDTAEQYGVGHDDTVRVSSRRGTVRMKASLSERIRADTVFVPFHWGGDQCINRLTNPALDPQAKMPEFKACAVHIQPTSTDVRRETEKKLAKS